MTKDGLNALNLEYNYLNLTAEVTDLSDNTLAQAQYRWLADGSKAGVRNNPTGSSGLEYLGSLVYKRDNTGLKLESAGFGGGRIEVSQGTVGNVYTPNYYITDHLGARQPFPAATSPPSAPAGLTARRPLRGISSPATRISRSSPTSTPMQGRGSSGRFYRSSPGPIHSQR